MFASKGRGVLLLEGDSLLFPHAVACENSTNPPYLVTFILLKDALIWKALPCGVYGSRDSPCILRAGGLYTLAGFSVPIFRALREGKGGSLSYLVPTCFPSYAATVSRLNAQTLPPNRYGVAFFCVLRFRCDILYTSPFTVASLVTVHGLSFQ